MASARTLMPAEPLEQDWKDLLAEILPSQGRWSEEEYLVLTDHRSRLIEYTDGFLEALPMLTDKHQAIPGFLYNLFVGLIHPRGGKVRFSPLRLRIRKGQVSRTGPTASTFRHRPTSPEPTLARRRPRPRSGLRRKTRTRPRRQAVRLCRGRHVGIPDRQPADRNDHRASPPRRRLRGSRCLSSWRFGLVAGIAGFFDLRDRGFRRRLKLAEA